MKRITSFLLVLVTYCLGAHISYGQSDIPLQPIAKQYGLPFKNVPDRRDVIIYQVNMREFSKGGNFKGVIARLDAIKAMGTNVLYLMPIYPVGILKSTNSPYCVRDYDAINKDFGTMADLHALVNGAHKRNMAVMLDWVANHTSFDNPWTANKSWYLQNDKGEIISPPGFNWNDVAQLNFKNMDMRQAMVRSMKNWVLKANIDGFRCDYADGPPVDFWKQAFDTLRNIKTHKLLFLAEGSHNDLFSAGFDFNFGFKFFGNLEDIFRKGKSVLSIDSLNTTDYDGFSNGQQLVRYTSNHDVNSSDGTPLELFGGKKGSMAAFVIVAYMKSVPFIYGGQEVGTPYRLSFPFTGKKIDWSLNPRLTVEYKKILAFRNRSKAIRRGELTSYSTADICAFTKELDGHKVLVFSNLRNKPVNYTMPARLLNTRWKDAFTGTEKDLHGELTIPPYTYLILKN